MSLLAIDRLAVRFRAASKLRAWATGLRQTTIEAVADASLTLEAGSAFALVGESGSGKTTLGRAVLGLVPVASGTIALEGAPLPAGDAAAMKAWRRRVAMTFQDPVGSLSPRLSVRRLVAEPFRIHADLEMSGRDRDAEVRRLLALVGLGDGFLDRYPHELSGGQARRIGIARALATGPKLVIADEPTAGLDVSVQGEVLNLLARLRDELGLALLLITHNLATVRLAAARTGVMYMGRLVETGPTARLFRAPAHPYTAALVAAMPVADPARRHRPPIVRGEVPSLLDRPQGCEFHTRCPFAAPRCRAERPEPTLLGDGTIVRCHFPLGAAGA